MNRHRRFLRTAATNQEEQRLEVQRGRRTDALVETLLDAQFSIDVEDLTPHQSDYWRWWVVVQQTSFKRTYEDSGDPLGEIAQTFTGCCKGELEVIRTISDTALELRWMRLSGDES